MKQEVRLVGWAILRCTIAIIVTGFTLFLPAGTLHYWQAWVYLAMLYIPMVLIIWYLFRYNPELLKRRLATKEKRPGQTVISYLFYASLGVIFMISGLDRRYGWSSVPLILVIISSALFLLGYLFLFLVFRENRYLAHTVTVEKGQEVVTTGPYAVLRHPMYSSELMMFVFAPLALGSYWALLPDVLLIALMAVRIVTEEAVLIRELKGYREYTEKTGYRLIPGVW